MEKIFIKNRKGDKIAVLLEKSADQKELVFLMHGLGGFKEQEQLDAFSEAFQEKGFSVVRFDTTNTLGESDGDYENATTTNYFEDLEDVISWSKSQKWYQEPFWLAGHSLGGMCTALYAEKYPEKVKAIAPTSAVVSYELFRQANSEEHLRNWEETDWRIEQSRSKPGVVKKLRWDFVEDLEKYDLIPNVKNLTMPVLLLVGELDTLTPSSDQGILYENLPGPKELHIIKGAEHTFREKEHLDEIKQIFLEWIEQVT